MKQYLLTLLIFSFLVMSVAFAQTSELPFVPPVHNYSQKEYNAGTQNWDISQDVNGIIYIANNQGLLSFNGSEWELHYLPEKKIARSIFIDGNRIYVGSFEEFGYFERNAYGKMKYVSLKERVSNYEFQNDEVWKILKSNNIIYFQTFSSYFTFDGKKINAFKPQSAPFGMYPADETIYVQGIESDFYKLEEENKLIPIIEKEKINFDHIVGAFPRNEQLILITIRNGLFIYDLKSKEIKPFKTDFDEQFRKISLNRVLKTSDSTLILGSLNKGIFAINFENGKKVWNIDKLNGLNNNTVLGLYEDSEKNIWVALDNGISHIETQSKLSFFNLLSDIELVEDMEVFQGKTYLASNKGLYFLDENFIKKFSGLNQQIWFVKKIDNQLFVGHNKGVSVIKNDKAQLLKNAGVGGMDIKKGIIHGQEVLIGSSYTFLTIYKKTTNGEWIDSHIVDGFSDLIKHIEIDHAGNIWADHVHKGVYHIQLEENLKKMKKIKLFNSNSPKEKESDIFRLLKVRGKPIFTDGTQFYTYDEEKQNIIPYESLNQNLSNLAKTHKIISINDDLFWFITDENYYLVLYENGKYQIKDKIAFKSLKKPSNEERATVFVNEQGESFFCLNECIAKYNPAKAEKVNSHKLFLKSISTYDRKSDTSNLENLKSFFSINYSKNNLVFDFAYPHFSKEAPQLMYYLENYDKRWNKSSTDFKVSYQNLPQGEYTLKTKVINDLDNNLSEMEIPFKIITPWYKSVVAFVMYAFIGVLLSISLIFFYFKYKLKKKARLLERQEKEITKLQNKMLEAELQHKSKALAGATMMNIKHDDFLEKLIIELENFMQKHKISKSQSKPIIQHIRENISKEDEWQVFEENFDMIHKNFFRNLKSEYPHLTSSDLRLCVLIRLNYSTKEIASMQGISIRGIETARYRLRKKLNLSENDTLTDFLISF
ncbi:triple tyrosine motif-containing protein [Capnocytophaga stomatis]|uniref:triple tyrosine motif-containing protein n=1 Tax=Capnocytophaga stomatis TaxID=1848904 RepID=UPI00385A515A